jgi:hypothetical protein
MSSLARQTIALVILACLLGAQVLLTRRIFRGGGSKKLRRMALTLSLLLGILLLGTLVFDLTAHR